MKDTIHRTVDLYKSLSAEVQDHIRAWHKRYGHYRAIHNNTSGVELRIQTLLSQKLLGEGKRVFALPAPESFPAEPNILKPNGA